MFGTGTAILIEEQDTPWFAEVLANLQLAFIGPGAAGAWVGFDMAFPVAEDGPFDATTRSNFHLGGVLSTSNK